MRRRLIRWIIGGALGLVVLLIAWLTVASIVYSPTYVSRVLRMRESSQVDYLENFPVRTLDASTNPFAYPEAIDPDVERRLAEVFAVDDVDAFLEETDSQSLLVISGDELVFERYANGADRPTILTSFSVAKSFDSLLVGVAIDEGLIASVDDPITDYLPELAAVDERLDEITIAHLLSMSSGLAYQEMRWGLFNGDDPLTTYHPDQREVSLDAARRVVDPPGQYFQYNKYHPQLLGMILERVTGGSVTEFTQTRLWEPAGMAFDGQWALDSDGSGFEKMEAGLNATAIDFAKLGSLFLSGGEWNGTRIVSTDWVLESTGPDPTRDREGHYRDEFGRWIHQDGAGWYAYFWYGRARGDAPHDYFAEGDHGQFIYVCPSADTVIVRLGSEFGIASGDWVDGFYDFCSS